MIIGDGSLGSHVCERFLADCNDVLFVDNLSIGSQRSIQHLLDHRDPGLMRHNVILPLHVEMDQIYSLACPASLIHYQSYPVQAAKISVQGAINMLGLVKRVPARILQASTSEICDDPQAHPLTVASGDTTGPFNLGNLSEFTIRQRAKELVGLTGRKSRIVHRPLHADDPNRRWPDISAMQQYLDWTLKVELQAGLIKTIGYLRVLLTGGLRLPSTKEATTA